MSKSTVNVNSSQQISDNWLRIVWRRFKKHRLALVGGIIILVFYTVAILAPVVAPYDPEELDPTRRLLGPSLAHPMGLDEVGRDVLSRVIYGTRIL